MTREEMIGRTDNLLFAAGDALEIQTIATELIVDAELLENVLREEGERREADGVSLVYRFFETRVQLATRSEFGNMIYNVLGKKSAEELTRAMMETLSIVAYRQPVTRPEIEEIRGVNSAYIMGALVDKGLIREAGRKEVVGRPHLYVTTDKFLRHFGIQDLSELPPVDLDQPTAEEEE
ncbi:MAG: SMC-Scp complex subunit ScpB [Christensenellaceae bacterium]|nr:SMC-Scp complex subunit ScpB [Christensenellaceae bacterium]